MRIGSPIGAWLSARSTRVVNGMCAVALLIIVLFRFSIVLVAAERAASAERRENRHKQNDRWVAAGAPTVVGRLCSTNIEWQTRSKIRAVLAFFQQTAQFMQAARPSWANAAFAHAQLGGNIGIGRRFFVVKQEL